MIHIALAYIKDSLNQYLKNEFPKSNVKVVLSNIVNTDGTIAKGTEGNIVLFLAGLNEETSLKNTVNRNTSASNGSFAKKQPPLHLNLKVMLCANFLEGKYVEGLTYLSSIIRFFQTNKKMAPNNLNEKIDKLTFELCNLEFGELSHLWSAIGSKLMPSLVYKVGILVFDDIQVTQIIPTIKEPNRQIDS